MTTNTASAFMSRMDALRRAIAIADAHKDPEFARELRAHLQFLNWTAENLRKQMQVR